MRALIAPIAVLVLAGFAGAADEKVDATLLIGKWEPKNPEKDAPAMVLEFAEKGKLTLNVTVNGQVEKLEGTYKVDGNKMVVELSFKGKSMNDTLTIVKLNDMELVTKGKNDKEEALKKIPEKGT
jgi:uncharacterized protein (TIGR03066 family)